jgi:hypothetical protein
LHRIQSFVTEILLAPLSESAAEPRPSAEWHSLRLREVVEAVLWLHLGTEMGAFPEDVSRSVYDRYLREFFESLLSPDLDARAAMKEGADYVAHSEESKALYIGLPRYARILFEKAMRAEDIFGSELIQLEAPLSLRGLFQTLLLLYTSFARSEAVRRFTYSVTFAPPEDWAEAWNPDIEPAEVVRAELSGSGSPSALVFAGYLAFWGYGARCGDAFERTGTRESASQDDLFRLKNRLQEILKWRIDLRSNVASQRFEKVRSKVTQELERESRQADVSGEAATLIDGSIERALEMIGVPVPVSERVGA